MYRAVAIIVASVVLLAPAAAAAPSFVIVRDESVGGLPRHGTVAQAIQVFGQPATRENLGYDQCRLTWPMYGVTMNTSYTGATSDPCGPEGRHKSTTVTDRRWRTSAGLKVKDPLRRLRALYPKAVKTAPGVWRLKARPFAGLAFSSLEAKVVNGSVVSFTLYGPRSAF